VSRRCTSSVFVEEVKGEPPVCSCGGRLRAVLYCIAKRSAIFSWSCRNYRKKDFLDRRALRAIDSLPVPILKIHCHADAYPPDRVNTTVAMAVRMYESSGASP